MNKENIEEGIKKVYKYLEENRDKRNKKVYIKLKKALKETLLKNYKEGFVSRDFFENYSIKIEELSKRELKEKKTSKIISVIAIVLVIGMGVVSGVLVQQLSETKKTLNETQGALVETQTELESSEKTLEITKNELDDTKQEIDIKEDQLTQIEKELEQTKEKLGIEEAKVKVEDLREFNSLPELQGWLVKNTVSENEYILDIYDCEDFAIDLVRDARKDGYEIFVLGMNWISTFTYIDISECDAIVTAREVGSWIDVKGIHKIESGHYYWNIHADRLVECFEPCILYDVRKYTALIIYETIELAGHAFCVARVNGVWYYIEAQADEVAKIGKEL